MFKLLSRKKYKALVASRDFYRDKALSSAECYVLVEDLHPEKDIIIRTQEIIISALTDKLFRLNEKPQSQEYIRDEKGRFKKRK